MQTIVKQKIEKDPKLLLRKLQQVKRKGFKRVKVEKL